MRDYDSDSIGPWFIAWAALIRECEEPGLKVYLGLDYEARIEDIRFN